MKILFLSNSIGGLRCFRYELIEKLIKRGDTVYIGANIEEPPSSFSELGCHIYSTPMDLRGTRPLADMKLLWRYLKLLLKLKPDVVMTYTIKPNVYGGIICRFLHIAQIPSITGLGTAFEMGGAVTKIAVWLYRWGLRKSKYVFFQNKKSRDIFRKYGIAPESEMLLVAGSGVNLAKFQYLEYPEDKDNIQFLFIGKTRKEKGIDHYLEAAEFIKQRYPECIFNIVGACEENYKERIDTLQKKGIIVYHGYQKNVISYIEKSHCNVLPSYHEGMSNSLQESSACGRPAIATNISGCREIVNDGETGFLVNSRDTIDLTNAIERFIQLPYQDKKEMGHAARRRMEELFDRNMVVNTYMERIDA